MNVVVDGVVYGGEPYGGIARLYDEILPRMCDADPSLAVTLMMSRRWRRRLPAHARIRCVPWLAADRFMPCGRLWCRVAPRLETVARRRAVAESPRHIWHSTYYTIPRRWRGPVVVTVVDAIHERFPQLFGDGGETIRRAKRGCLEAADAVIAISATTKRDVEAFYGVDGGKIRVVPLACSDVFGAGAAAGAPARPGGERPFLLYVGRRSRYKNVDLLLHAYAEWPRRGEVDLVVVGRDWSADEVRELARLGLRDRVRLLGYADDEALARLYRHAVALVYPSLYEGFGVPLLEAMASGCPVVASRIPATVEVATEVPIYFEPTDAEDLRRALDLALAEGRESSRVRTGRQHVTRYSWDQTARATLDVYRSLH